MSAELPKTPLFSPKSVEGKGESTRAMDEVIDTPEALRRLAKRVKDILEGLSGEANAFEHSGDHADIDNSRPNDKWAVPEDDTLFDMSDFGCHEHIEEAKETKEQKDERVPLNGTPSILMVGAKLAETWETGTTADGTTENLPRKSEHLPHETEIAHQRAILLPSLQPRYTPHPTRRQRRTSTQAVTIILRKQNPLDFPTSHT